MADPRKSPEYKETGGKQFLLPFLIDGTTITFDKTKPGGSDQVGLAVRLKPGGPPKTIELVGDGERILGVLDHVEPDGIGVVHLGPVIVVKGGQGATLTPGSRIIGALGAGAAEGYAKSVNPATLADVANGMGEILDAADPTAVRVLRC